VETLAHLIAAGDHLIRVPLAADGTSWWDRNSEALITIVAVVVAALLLTWVVRRATHRLVERIVRSNEERLRETEAELETAGMEGPAPAPVVSPQGVAATLRPLAPQSERVSQRAQTLGSVLRNAATVIIWVIAGLLILGELNVDLAPLLAGAGIAGVALGFGAQYIVSDLLSGMFMIAEDQYGVGDVIDLGEANGTVEEVTLRVTKVRDIRGTVWYVRNGQIQRVGNKSQLWARVILDIGVAYDTDIEKASCLIKQVADEVWREKIDEARVLEEPTIWGVQDLGADAIVIRVGVKTRPGEQWAVARLIRARVKTAFDDAGITIPFPQRTIWVNPVGDDAEADRAAGATDLTQTPQ